MREGSGRMLGEENTLKAIQPDPHTPAPIWGRLPMGHSCQISAFNAIADWDEID